MPIEETRQLGDELLNISIPEIVILQHISRFIGPTVRFNLYQEFNRQNPLGYNFSPTKFYRSLDKLEEIGVIKYSEGDRPKSKNIAVTEKAEQILKQINKITIFNALSGIKPINYIFNEILNNYEKSDLGTAIVIDAKGFERLDSQKIKLISDISQSIHLLVRNDIFETYINYPNHSKFRVTEIENRRIREPEDYFDCVILTGYEFIANSKTNITIEGLDINLNGLFDEIKRIVKSNGLIIVPVYESFGNQSHFMVHSLEKILNETGLYRPVHRNDLMSLFDENQLKTKIFDKSGIVFAVAQL